MKRTISSGLARRVRGAFAIAAMVAAVSASAQPVIGPTVRSHFRKAPVPFDRTPLAAENRTLGATANTVATNAAVAPEIVELARALRNDPDLIYQYVHDNIEFSPLWGLLKGPVGTLLDGRGDSFDQAALMVALLKQASLTNSSISNVTFQFGQLKLDSTQLHDWLGVDSDPDSVGGILGSGDIPGSLEIANGTLYAYVYHVWVKVSIDGVPFVFDPAFKSHNWTSGIVSSLADKMQYNKGTFIADAAATVTGTSIRGVNRDRLRKDLTTYANNLASYIRSNPKWGIRDIVGDGTITRLINGQIVRLSQNPNQYGGATDWTTIPPGYSPTLSITLPGATPQVYNSVDIYGHRLSIFFNSSYVPTLYLDGTAVATGSAASQGAQVAIALKISIPWDSAPDHPAVQTIIAETAQNGGGYVVQTGWDQVGRGMIEKHRKVLTQAMNSGAAANSELVLGESLAVLGYTWLAECAAQQRLADQLLGTRTMYHYGGGIVGQSVGESISGPYVDLPLNLISTPARLNGSARIGSLDMTANSTAAYLDFSGASSSFESTTLEQTQASVPGFAAASTVKLLDIAMQNGDTLFDINNGDTDASHQTYANIIKPTLVPNYDSTVLAAIDQAVMTDHKRVIAPLHGKISVGKWTGVGFKTMRADGGYGEIILGGLSGGISGTNVTAANLDSNAAFTMISPYTVDLSIGTYAPGATPPSGDGTANVGDPLDHLKGSYLYQHEDLTTGSRPFPFGLSLERTYDSGAQDIRGPFGAGWTHNYAITATVGSDGFSGMGQSSPLAAVGSIVALYVSSDLMKGQELMGQPNLELFALETVVNRWFTDQLTQNVVNVQQGWNTEQFTKLADGSYAPQLGSAAILDVPGGQAFRYRTTNGATLNFNPAGQISSWNNAAGASVSFSYGPNGLSTVTNASTGRTLKLNYSGNLVSSVSDGPRTVSYGYTGNNLTSYTDALQKGTRYQYDTSGSQDTVGHLTHIFYPSNPTNAFVVNYYDSLGRVKQQADANAHSTQAFFAGSRTEIVDPAGARHVWYNDPFGNVTSETQDYGPNHLNLTTSNTYDAQHSLLTTTFREGDSVAFTYDALFNPLSIDHYPKPPSKLAPQRQSFTYITPVASLPNFEEILTSTDSNQNVTTYSYDSTTGTLLEIDQPAVAKPGVAGLLTPKQVFTYTLVGLPQTIKDAEGRTTHYEYGDSTHADQITQATLDYRPGGLNLTKQYSYNSFGDVKSVTDANGNTTNSAFDNLRQVIEIDAPVPGVVTKVSYFPNGQIHTIKRSNGSSDVTQYTYAYTLSDKISSVTDAPGGTSAKTYDVNDRVQTVTQQVTATQSQQRTYSYDAIGRLIQVYDTTAGSPVQLLETHDYTANGRDLSFTDANNHVTVQRYDDFDRLSQTTFPNQKTQTILRDSNGNVLQLTTPSNQNISFTYDSWNRIATKTPQGEVAGKVTYGYDYTGRLLQAADESSGTPFTIGYDTAGRASSYTDQKGRVVVVEHDGVGNRTKLQWPAGTNGSGAYFVRYQFDPLNRMTEIDANGSKLLAKYDWDAFSRLALITYGDDTTDKYSQYDGADNLQTLAQSFAGGQNNVTFTYGWLNNHQRQTTMVNNGVFQYTPFLGMIAYGSADANNGYTSVGPTALTYDGNRNLTFDGSNALTYDVENRLIQAQNALNGPSQYLYDPLGHRKQKQTNGVTTEFILAGDDEIADIPSAGVGLPPTLTVRGVGGLPVAAVVPAAGGQPESIVYYHHDVLGSTVAATAPGQSGAEAFTYGEFGDPGAGDILAYRFAGYRYDPETRLYYVRARHYSPALGRFLQTDPIGLAGGPNLYAYVNNDPLNDTDPAGLCATYTEGAAFGLGVMLLNDGLRRAQYAQAASLLSGQSAARTALQADVYSQLSPIGKGLTDIARAARVEQLAGKTVEQLAESASRTSPLWNAIGSASEYAGVVGAVAGVGIAASNVLAAPEGQGGQVAAGQAGALYYGMVGGYGGAFVGGLIGSAIAPGIGTVVGAGVGAVLGGAAGGVVGQIVGTKIYQGLQE